MSATAAAVPASSSSSPSSSLDAQLIAATRDGKGFDECKALIDKGARVNGKNSNRNTALHYAARYGQDALAKLLLEQGAVPNVKNTNGWTPLHEAANNGHAKLCKLLLQHKADCNSKGMHGYTPLHDAAIKGHRDVVYLLIDHGANCLAKNNEGKTVHDVLPSRGLTSMDLHLYKALQPTRSAIAKLTMTCQQHQQELLNIKDNMARQRKADFDTLRRETHDVQQSLQQLLLQQAAKHEQQLQAQKSELLAVMMRNTGGISTTTTTQLSLAAPSSASNSSSSNDYNASAKSSSSSSLAEKNLEKSLPPSMATGCSSSTFVVAGNNAADTTTTALALQRLVLQRNNDMSTLRREIQGTQESLAKMLRDQVEDKVKATMIKIQKQCNGSSNGSTEPNESSSSSSDLRQDVTALRDEFTANKENIQAEMINLKKEIMLVQKTSSAGNNAIASRSRAASALSSLEIGGGDNDAAAEQGDDNHLKQLHRKKIEKEEAAISAMRDAFMRKHQADLEKVRAEIVAAEEHLMGLIQQQMASSSSSSSLSSSNKKSSRSTPETANHEQDESTCQGEEGDYVTHAELKKSLYKKTKKQEASLAELREEFTKLMEFLEHVDVGSLRDDMMELVNSQVEQQNAVVAELREAIVNQRPLQKATPGLPPIQEANKKIDRSVSSEDDDDDDDEDEDDDDDEDDGAIDELKKTIEMQGEAQRKTLTALSDKLSLLRKQDMAALREETASTREHLENQMQQQAQQQETMIAALRDEMSTGVVRPSSKQGDTLNGIRDEIQGMEESLKALIQNQSKKQDAALAALQKKLAMKEKDGKSATLEEMSLKLIQQQQQEIKAQHQSDISTLKKEILATKVSLKRLSDQQKSNQTSAVKESRKVGRSPAANDDDKAYEDLKKLVEEQEKVQRETIAMLQKDIRATNEKLNQLSAEHEGKSVPMASPLQTGRPKWSPRSLMSPLSPKARSARDVVNEAHHEQGTSAPSEESLPLIQKQQEELTASPSQMGRPKWSSRSSRSLMSPLSPKPRSTRDVVNGAQHEQQQADIANLQKEISSTKERLKEITEQQQEINMAALEEKFIAKENVNQIIQQSLCKQDSQREDQIKSLLRTQQELDELIKNLEEHRDISSSEQKGVGDKEQEDQLRTDIADLRAMVSNYILALKETMEEIAALREQVDAKVPDEVGASDASSKDSKMLEELDRMFDGQSKDSPNEEEVTLQEELRKVTAELKMVQAMADRYKETVMKLHQISEQALS